MRAIFLLLGLLPLSIFAEILPEIPSSNRLLTAEEVQHYWFNTLKNQAVPKRPSGSHPLQQRIWDRERDADKAKLQAVLRGKFRKEAYRAALAHNIGVYRLKEKWEALTATQTELQKILEHEARLALIEAKQESAERIADAAEREAEAAEREARAAEREAQAAIDRKANPPKVEVVEVHDEPVRRTPFIVNIVPIDPPAPCPQPTPRIPRDPRRR